MVRETPAMVGTDGPSGTEAPRRPDKGPTLSSPCVVASRLGKEKFKATVGVMPQPATMPSGSVHFHNNLPVNVHVHDGDKGAGHVHEATHHFWRGGQRGQ